MLLIFTLPSDKRESLGSQGNTQCLNLRHVTQASSGEINSVGGSTGTRVNYCPGGETLRNGRAPKANNSPSIHWQGAGDWL